MEFIRKIFFIHVEKKPPDQIHQTQYREIHFTSDDFVNRPHVCLAIDNIEERHDVFFNEMSEVFICIIL